MSAREHDLHPETQGQIDSLLVLQRDLLAIVARPGRLQERLDRLCERFEQTVDGTVATVMRLDASRKRLHFVSAPHAPTALLKVLDHVKPGDGNGSCAHAAWSGKATYVGDASVDPHWASLRDVAEHYGVRACWSSPIRDREGKTIGTFALTSLNVRLPDALHRQLLDLGALCAGLLFDQARQEAGRVRDERKMRRLALAFDTSPHGVLFTDTSGMIEDANAAALALLGKTRGQILPHSLGGALGVPSDHVALAAALGAIACGEPFTCTLQLTMGGVERTLQLGCAPRKDGKGLCDGAVIMLVDLTDLQRLSAFNTLLAQVDRALASHREIEPLLQEICELAVRHAGLRLAWIGRPDAQTGWFKPLAAAGPGKEYLKQVRISSRQDRPEGRGPCGLVWNQGASRFDDNFEFSPQLKPWAHLARRHGFATIAVLPIHRDGQLWGELCVYHPQTHAFDAAMRQLLETLALNISHGLDRIELARREHDSLSLSHAMLQSTSVGITLTRERVIQFANQRAADILGAQSPDELIGQSTRKFYRSDAAHADAGESIRAQYREAHRAVLEVELNRLDGSRIWARIEGAPFSDDDYDEIWSLIDITDRHLAERTRALLADALGTVEEGVVITDAHQRIVYANDAFIDMTGYAYEELIDGNCRILQGPDTDQDTVDSMRRALHEERAFHGRILNYRKDHSTFWNLLTITPLHDAEGKLTQFVGVQRDITDMQRLTERMEYLAFHDELTALPNRRALDRYFGSTLNGNGSSSQRLAVCILDLDDFKLINDRHGHVCGDHLLCQVAERIQPVIGEGDFFARLGGDEFVIIFGLPSRWRIEHHLRKRIDALGEQFEEPVDVGIDAPVRIRLSMGVSLYPSHASEGGKLLRLADTALFEAKKHKRRRDRWWILHGESTQTVPEPAATPYGKQAASLLAAVHAHMVRELPGMIESFYALLQRNPQTGEVLSALLPGEIDALKQRQLRHAGLLVAATTHEHDVLNAGRRAGRVHALVGIDTVTLFRWMTVYHDSLTALCRLPQFDAWTRHQLVQVLEHRLHDDLKAQVEAHLAVQEHYAAIANQFVPDRNVHWNDIIRAGIRWAAHLPGMHCVMILRQGTEDAFAIEYSAGTGSARVAAILREDYAAAGSRALAPGEASLISRSWNMATIETEHALDPDTRDGKASLPPRLVQAGVRTCACIPLLDASQRPAAMVLLLGRFPNQFKSRPMQQFLHNLQLRGNQIWQHSMRPPAPMPYEQSVAFRQRLFKGGLRILVQPIVDLDDGRLRKVEALARLETEQGDFIGPDVFLPLLRRQEMALLFQHVLDMALGDLVALGKDGHDLGLTVNISPQTLEDGNCPGWVRKALRHHGIEPHRLILEMLETERLEHMARTDTVQQLLDAGVRMAIDDLGSGYSSLRRLASLPFHTVKVDQDLFAHLLRDPARSISLISAVIQIGRDFDCEVIAEGLEDAGMIEVARLLGASQGQGYAIARPMPAADLPAWQRGFRLADQAHAPATLLGALAYQWISLRYGSKHADTLEACPLTPVLEHYAEGNARKARSLHAAVHAAPDDEHAARRLLEWIQDCIRARHRDQGRH